MRQINHLLLPLIAIFCLSALPALAQERNCLDKKDNDKDGYADCADRDCQLHAEVCERREDWIERSEGSAEHIYPDTISVYKAIQRGDPKIFLSQTNVDGTYAHSSTRLYQDLTFKGKIKATHFLVRDGDYYNYAWKIVDKESGDILEEFMIETPIPVKRKVQQRAPVSPSVKEPTIKGIFRR